MDARSLVFFTGLLIVLTVPCDSITLDTHEPLLRTPPSEHQGDADDYFGYSATLHNTMDPGAQNTFQQKIEGGKILVGVPGGTAVGAEVNRTGYVVECPLTPGVCTPMRGSGSGDDLLLYDTSGNMPSMFPSSSGNSSKEGMFLGGKVKSSGEFFMACGHRFLSDNTGGHIQGYCLLSGRTLRDFEQFNPCSTTTDHARSSRIRTSIQPVGSKPFFVCMAGTDIVFDGSTQFVVGSLGLREKTGQEGGVIFSTTSPISVSSFRLQEAVVVDDTIQYAGYSIAYGSVLDMGSRNIIVGAPRTNSGFGSVIVSRTLTTSPFMVNLRINLPAGKLIGSYFGHSVAAVDFNGDGFDEVVVGAPFYFKNPASPDIGAFYVFNNDGGSVKSDSYVIVEGTRNLKQFGHALAAMGDMNYDGLEDLAVSAPYGAAGTSSSGGTVFIYSGSSSGITTTPAQVIEGTRLNLMSPLLRGISSFGISLSGDIDVDGNCYNDLVIGAFESRQVFVLRSRTVAVIKANVTTNVSFVPISGAGEGPCVLSGDRYDCFEVTYHLSVTGKCFSAGQQFNVTYTLYGDAVQSGSSRVFLGEKGVAQSSGSMMLTLNAPEITIKRVIYVTNPETIYQTPITPSISASIPLDPPPPPTDGNTTLDDLILTRVFSRQDPSPASTEVLGLRECEDVNNCTSDLSITTFSHAFDVPDNNDPNVLLLGSATKVTLSMTLSVAADGESAYGVCVEFSLHPILRYTSTNPIVGFDRCTVTSKSTDCCLFSPLTKGTQKMVSVTFNIDDSGFNNESAVITATAKLGPGSFDTNAGNNAKVYQFKISPSTDIQVDITFDPTRQFTVSREYESRSGLPENFDQLGRQVTTTFSFLNNGPSEVTSGSVSLSIPYRSACTKNAFLYYVASIQNAPACSIQPSSSVNALNISQTSNSPEQMTLGDVPGSCSAGSTTTIQISCGQPSVECVEVRCNVSALQVRSTFTVEVVGYLDEYFYINTRNHYTLQFKSNFELQRLRDPTSNLVTRNLVLTNPNVVTPAEPVPWWAIVVPIVVAILLIIALIVVLYLCGFFKRKRSWTPDKEELTDEEGNPQGENEENGNENNDNTNPENVASSSDDVVESTDPGVV